jgi:uncharacterized membrane protein
VVQSSVSLGEILTIYGEAVLVQTSRQPHASPLILKMSSTTWLVGGLGSLGFALAGLVADSHRMTAFIALIVTIATFLVCGLQMLV